MLGEPGGQIRLSLPLEGWLYAPHSLLFFCFLMDKWSLTESGAHKFS